jgi:hypothetical protein
MELKTEFKESEYWDSLAEIYLSRYTLPKWSEKPTIPSMELWLDRLDIPKKKYEAYINTSLSDLISLNQTWPLRAHIGMFMEYKQGS